MNFLAHSSGEINTIGPKSYLDFSSINSLQEAGEYQCEEPAAEERGPSQSLVEP